MNIKKKKMLLLCLITFVAVVGLLFLVARDKPITSVLSATTVFDESLGLKLNHPEVLKNEQLTDQDRKDKFVLRLTRSSPPIIVTVRYEDNIRSVVSATKQSQLDLLTDSLLKSYPDRYPNFKLIEKNDILVGGKNSKEFIFTYKSPSDITARQRFIIISKTQDIAVYISMQSQETEYEINNKTYFEDIIKSISLN